MKPNLPRIYCDMDGVLCDFEKHLEKQVGMSINKWAAIPDIKGRWDKVIENPRFWHTMPWHTEGKKLWNYIKDYKPHILSAYVEHAHDPNCIPGKSYWARTNLGIGTNRINLVKRVQKQNYAKVAGQPAVLIDDYIKNTTQFTERGGYGIQFKSANQVIAELKKLGF
jgi:hypothetical protein